MIKVFGHQAPDTDTVCSAILWAHHLNNHTATPSTPYRLGDLNNETTFVLNYWEVPSPELLESVSEQDTVAIVDTNNTQELFPNINETNIVEIIDHHKLVGGLSTKKPATLTIRPLSSTATVIYDRMGEAVATLPRAMKGLVLSCILSDTLAFRSPTTTPHDRALAERLAEELGVSIEDYAGKMFEAKSDISDLSDEALIKLDSKKFPVGDKTLRVSVVESAAPHLVLARKENLLRELTRMTESEADVFETLFFIVDIIKEESVILVHSDTAKAIYEKSFGITITSDTHILPGIISRKTQIVPALSI